MLTRTFHTQESDHYWLGCLKDNLHITCIEPIKAFDKDQPDKDANNDACSLIRHRDCVVVFGLVLTLGVDS